MRESTTRIGEPVRWGILGTGTVACAFAAGLRRTPGARLQAVASRSRPQGQAFAARFGAAAAHEGAAALLADPAVEVVYVASPNALHREHALAAIAAGKAVLVEKPFALDAAEGREIAAAARTRGTFCMEAMWMRLSPAVREAVAATRAGALGEPRLLVAQLGFPHRYDPAGRLFAPAGGGVLLDLGVYPLALAHALLGRPARVQASAVRAPTGVDEQVSALLSYAGGAQAVVTASLRCRLANAATFHGTAGILRLEPLFFPQRYARVATPPPPTRGAGGGLGARLRALPLLQSLNEARVGWRERARALRVPGGGYAFEAAEVGRHLRAGLTENPDWTLDDTLAVLETADAVRAAWT